MWGEDKQLLLDELYRKGDPIKKLDKYFMEKIVDFKNERKGDPKLIEEELRLNKEIPEPVRENLLINLDIIVKDKNCH